jgi:hypothetical protein
VAYGGVHLEWAFRMIYRAADGLLDDLIAQDVALDTGAVGPLPVSAHTSTPVDRHFRDGPPGSNVSSPRPGEPPRLRGAGRP